MGSLGEGRRGGGIMRNKSSGECIVSGCAARRRARGRSLAAAEAAHYNRRPPAAATRESSRRPLRPAKRAPRRPPTMLLAAWPESPVLARWCYRCIASAIGLRDRHASFGEVHGSAACRRFAPPPTRPGLNPGTLPSGHHRRANEDRRAQDGTYRVLVVPRILIQCAMTARSIAQSPTAVRGAANGFCLARCSAVAMVAKHAKEGIPLGAGTIPGFTTGPGRPGDPGLAGRPPPPRRRPRRDLRRAEDATDRLSGRAEGLHREGGRRMDGDAPRVRPPEQRAPEQFAQLDIETRRRWQLATNRGDALAE